jgi:hypothetical protein
MRKSKFSESQSAEILKEAEALACGCRSGAPTFKQKWQQLQQRL